MFALFWKLILITFLATNSFLEQEGQSATHGDVARRASTQTMRIVVSATLAQSAGFLGHFQVFNQSDDWLTELPIFIESADQWALAQTVTEALQRAELRARSWVGAEMNLSENAKRPENSLQSII